MYFGMGSSLRQLGDFLELLKAPKFGQRAVLAEDLENCQVWKK
jgi:hypothetical protein